MMFSNDGGFGTPAWQPYQEETTWTLPDPGRRSATLVVYTRFRDTEGELLCGGASVSDDIIYDPSPPAVVISVRPLDLPNPSPGNPTQLVMVEINGVDDADGSGIAEMQISTDAQFMGARWQPFQARTEFSVAPEQAVYVRLRDRVGNTSATSSGTPTYTIQLPLVYTAR